MQIKFFLFLLFFLLNACARAPISNRENSLRLVTAPDLSDDLPWEPFFSAVKSEIKFLEERPFSQEFHFGTQSYTQNEYLAGLKKLIQLKDESGSDLKFFEAVKDSFDFYEVYGDRKWGEVRITSYYEPVIPGSRQKTSRFDTPLYQVPNDLFNLDLNQFDAKFGAERKLRARIEGKTIHPYYTREDIDDKGALKGQNLEICWVNALDAYDIQVQGSGTVQFADGKYLSVNYGDKNGHRFLTQEMDALIKKKMAKESSDRAPKSTSESYLRSLPRSELQTYLNMNPSYVFFKPSSQRAVTYMGLPASDGRTIATDEKYFPKGAVGFLNFNLPITPATEDGVPPTTQRVGRFVLDQDIGGVIQGGGRVDLFYGRGKEIRPFAWSVNDYGSLYYLAPKRTRMAPHSN